MKEKLRERLLFVGSKVGYPLFYVFALVVFATWTFPFEKIKNRIIVTFNAEQRATPSPKELSIEELSSSWLTGVKLTGIRLTEPSPDKGKPPTEMKIESVVARVALLPLIAGNHDVSFHMAAFGGTIDGSWAEHGKDVDLDLSFDGLDVAQVTPIADFLGAPAEGSLGGTISIELPEGKVVDPKSGAVSFKTGKANGSISFEAHDLAIGDGKSKVRGALAIPRLGVGTLTLTADVKDGAVRISKIGSASKDVEFAGDGRVMLRDPLSDSAADFNLRFRINDAYRSKNDTTKSLFGAPGSTIPGVMDLDPKMKQSKRPDGFYAWHGRGPLSKLEFTPGGTGGPGAPASTAASAAPKTGSGP